VSVTLRTQSHTRTLSSCAHTKSPSHTLGGGGLCPCLCGFCVCAQSHTVTVSVTVLKQSHNHSHARYEGSVSVVSVDSMHIRSHAQSQYTAYHTFSVCTVTVSHSVCDCVSSATPTVTLAPCTQPQSRKLWRSVSFSLWSRCAHTHSRDCAYTVTVCVRTQLHTQLHCTVHTQSQSQAHT